MWTFVSSSTEGAQRGLHAAEGGPGQHPHHDHHRGGGQLDHDHQDHHEEHRAQLQVRRISVDIYCQVLVLDKTLFRLGEEFEEETTDGRKCKTTVTMDGNKLVTNQKAQGGGKDALAVSLS